MARRRERCGRIRRFRRPCGARSCGVMGGAASCRDVATRRLSISTTWTLRSEGGDHDEDGLVVLCSAHHRAQHRGHLLIEGRVSTGLRFRHADGRGYGAEVDAASAIGARGGVPGAARSWIPRRGSAEGAGTRSRTRPRGGQWRPGFDQSRARSACILTRAPRGERVLSIDLELRSERTIAGALSGTMWW